MADAVLIALDAVGTAAFAASGALQGARRGFDLFGVVTIAAITAVGGGALRDVLLGHLPPFVIVQPIGLIEALGVGLLVFVLLRLGRALPGQRVLLYADAVGLAAATAIGSGIAAAAPISTLGAIIVGAMSGCAGGIVRDLLCGAVPTILRKEIYATAALAGAAVVVSADRFALPAQPAMWTAVAVTAIIRLWSAAVGAELPRAAPADESARP